MFLRVTGASVAVVTLATVILTVLALTSSADLADRLAAAGDVLVGATLLLAAVAAVVALLAYAVSTGLPGLRHEPVQALRAVPVLRGDLGPAARHVLGHIRIRHLRAVLISQPLEDPPGSMPLLARRGQVLPQHLIDPPGHRLAHRRGPRAEP